MKVFHWVLLLSICWAHHIGDAKAKKKVSKGNIKKTVLTCHKLKINNLAGVADMEGLVKVVTDQGFISSDKGKIFFVPREVSEKDKAKTSDNEPKKSPDTLFKNNNNIKQAIFTSNVKFIYSGYDIASDNALYDGGYEIMMLEGHVHINDNATRSTSSFFIYNMKEESGRLLSEADYQQVKPYYDVKNIKYIYNYFYGSKTKRRPSKVAAISSSAGNIESGKSSDDDENLEDTIKKSPNRVTIYRNLSDQGDKQKEENNKLNE